MRVTCALLSDAQALVLDGPLDYPAVASGGWQMRKLFTDWDKKDTRNVLLALAIAFIFLYVRDILNFVSTFVVKLSELITQSFVDDLYFEASADVSHLILFQIFTMLMIAPLAFIMGTVRGLRPRREPISLKIGNIDVLDSYLKTVDRKFRRLLLILSIPLFIASGVMITYAYVPIYASINFHRDLDSLAPVLSEDQHNQIVSHWASMSSKADYDAINGVLKKLAQTHGLKLPTPIK